VSLFATSKRKNVFKKEEEEEVISSASTTLEIINSKDQREMQSGM
jgi:hypothetical protein